MYWKLHTCVVLAILSVLLICGDAHDQRTESSKVQETLDEMLKEIMKLNQKVTIESDIGDGRDKLVQAWEQELSASQSSGCIQIIQVTARTGRERFASQFERRGANPNLVLVLDNQLTYRAELKGDKFAGAAYEYTIDTTSQLSPALNCLERNEISEVYLEAVGRDGWLVASISTSVSGADNVFTVLTADPDLNKWVDGDEADLYPYDAKLVPLTLITELPSPTNGMFATDTPECGFGNRVCECNFLAQTCIINLEVDEIQTFTSYEKFQVGNSQSVQMRGAQGVVYSIDEDSGEAEPLSAFSNRNCAKDEYRDNCTEPEFVDGKTYRVGIAVNGQIPGPTLIVHEGQNVVIHVHNNLSTEGISVHWHGMHQMGTPWMDGVGQITQCHVGPGSTYSYNYIATPSGTFWYHSHSGAQRTDGFFGTLIVKEAPDKMERIRDILSDEYGITRDFEDLPDEHSLTLIDWQLEISILTVLHAFAGLGFYEGVPIGEVPTNCDTRYRTTVSNDNTVIGPIPYYSGLINGKGRNPDVPYSKTRLSVFTVTQGESYRFRLIGAQGLYAYKFSIDGHRLTVVGTDGYWTKPVKNVDFIIIHTGERYDFILDADQPIKNYWMRAETLEINTKGSSPYQSLGHVAEGILQYVESATDTTEIPSTSYEDIKLSSPAIECSSTSPCNAVNCPFENYQTLYYTDCTNVNELELLEATPLDQMPEANPSDDCPDCFQRLAFSFRGAQGWASINYLNFILPPVPPQTQNEAFYEQAELCNITGRRCETGDVNCICTYEITIPYNETIQFALTSPQAHPIHLHGHTFHVVDVGYPTYDPDTGFVSENNRYTNRKHTINDHTIRKDTVIIPAGGWVVINFLSDNPGYWFLHCHIEVHQVQGMAVIINEAPEQQKLLDIPDGLNTCGDFYLNSTEYTQILKNSMNNLGVNTIG